MVPKFHNDPIVNVRVLEEEEERKNLGGRESVETYRKYKK